MKLELSIDLRRTIYARLVSADGETIGARVIEELEISDELFQHLTLLQEGG